MNSPYQIVLSRAAYGGDARTMRSAALAISAISEILRTDSLNGYQRAGLYEALEIAADSLSWRAESIEETLNPAFDPSNQEPRS